MASCGQHLRLCIVSAMHCLRCCIRFWDWGKCKNYRVLKAHDGVCTGCLWYRSQANLHPTLRDRLPLSKSSAVVFRSFLTALC